MLSSIKYCLQVFGSFSIDRVYACESVSDHAKAKNYATCYIDVGHFSKLPFSALEVAL